MHDRRFENKIFEYFNMMQSLWSARPLNLGGATAIGGGSGGPPGGFIGYLPQTRVAYDLSEIGTLATPASGRSLVDNLNHIRYRITTLETNPLGVSVEYGNSLVGSGITVLNFEGGFQVEAMGGGQVNITASGVNHYHTESQIVDLTKKVKVSSDDTTADYLETKLIAGSNITLTVSGIGDNETLRITALLEPSASGGGDMYKFVYDPDDDGTVDSANAVKIQGRNISTTAPLTGQSLIWASGIAMYKPGNAGANLPTFWAFV